MIVADETSWPACLFLLKILMEQIVKLEKQEDSRIITSKASPHLKTFTGDSDDFRFHHYFDLICGAREGGLAAVMLGHLRLSLEEMVTRFTDCSGSAHHQILERSTSPREFFSQIHTALHLEEIESKEFRLPLRSPQDARQQNASQLLSVSGMCQTVHVVRSYRRPEAIEPVSLVDVCEITMADLRHCTVDDVDYARLLANEVQVLYNRTGRLHCLLELGSKSTIALEDSEHLQIGNLKELSGYVTSESTAEAEEYCSAQGLYDKLESCARVLVESRLSRARTIEWGIFAFSDRYMCSVCREEGREVDTLDRPAFFDHVDYVHDFYDLEPPEMFKIQEVGFYQAYSS